MEPLARRIANAFENELAESNIRELFLEYDVYGTGKLRPREFRAALRTVGVHLTRDEFQIIMESFDTDNDGKLSYTDFVRLCEYSRETSSEMQSKYTEDALQGRKSTTFTEYDALEASKPRDIELRELRQAIRRKLVAREVSSSELYRMMNRKGDGALDAYEFCYGCTQLLGLEVSVDDIIDAYELTETDQPYYLSHGEFAERVLGRAASQYKLNPAVDDDRVNYRSKATPKQDEDAMNHRVLKNALRGNRHYKHRGGTFDTLDEDATTEEVMFKVIDSFNETHLKMRRIFKDLDLDRSGKLSKTELASGLKAIGLVLSGYQINSIMRLFDNDGSGELSYPEFVRMLGFVSHQDKHRPSRMHESKPKKKYQQVSHRGAMRKNREAVREKIGTKHTLSQEDYDLIKDISDSVYDRRKSVRKIFRSMDQDGSGSLDAAEAHHGFKQLGIQISQNHVEKLITVFDRNNDGSLNYSDFVNFLASSTKKINDMDHLGTQKRK
eukprot:g15342.t1